MEQNQLIPNDPTVLQVSFGKKKFTKGEDFNFDVQVIDSKTGQPFDLTGVTLLTAHLPKDGGGCIDKILGSGTQVVANTYGIFNVQAASGDNYKVGEDQSWWAEIVKSSKTYKLVFEENLDIEPDLLTCT